MIIPRWLFKLSDNSDTERIPVLTQINISLVIGHIFKCDCQFKHSKNCFWRKPNRRDSDYFDFYANPHWKPIPLYQKLFTRLYRWLYLLSGPKVLLPVLGNCSEIKILWYSAIGITEWDWLKISCYEHKIVFSMMIFILTLKFKTCNEVSKSSTFRKMS